MGIIYKATNVINGKIYVGKTTLVLAKRVQKHVAVRKRPRQVVHLAIAKYGAENFSWDVLETVPNEMLDDAEKRWIASLNTTVKEIGYNRSTGGDGGHRSEPDSLETRRKKSLGMMGKQNAKGSHDRRKPMSQAHKDAIALAMKGKNRQPKSAIHRQRLSESAKRRVR
jgi:group I intron endonuclease